jgi:N-methylhydantoinase B
MSSPTEHRLDAVELEIIKASLDGIVQEMQNSLFRTGYSTIVREQPDLFD